MRWKQQTHLPRRRVRVRRPKLLLHKDQARGNGNIESKCGTTWKQKTSQGWYMAVHSALVLLSSNSSSSVRGLSRFTLLKCLTSFCLTYFCFALPSSSYSFSPMLRIVLPSVVMLVACICCTHLCSCGRVCAG